MQNNDAEDVFNYMTYIEIHWRNRSLYSQKLLKVFVDIYETLN